MFNPSAVRLGHIIPLEYDFSASFWGNHDKPVARRGTMMTGTGSRKSSKK
jgi:hypothetical protein